MDATWLLLPPVAFLLLLLLLGFASALCDALAAKTAPGKPMQRGKWKAYACGEHVPNHRVQPDYGQFFPFAFFFTIMHVVALVVATAPTGARSFASAFVASLFLLSAAAGLFALFRR